MPSKKSILQKEFIKNYLQTKNITEAARKIGIERKTFYNWLKTKKFEEMFNNAIEQHNDKVEQLIYSLAESGDKEMLKFWAKHKMKDRGFIETQNLQHSGEVKNKIDKIEVEVIRTNNEQTQNKDN
ncbi:MAG: helix-turn-helix domain-containing protein [Promethearchaeia archaeon]